jgi:hypothetical protein
MRLCRIFLHEDDFRFELLRESTSYFGYNPRRCFRASSIKKLNTEKTEVAEAINTAGDHIKEIFDLVHGARSGNLPVSHKIFQISPDDDDPEQLLAICRVGPVSSWAFDLLLCRYESYAADKIAEFYHQIKATSGPAGSLRRYMFERQVLNYFCSHPTESSVSIRGLVDSKKMPWSYNGPTRRITFDKSTFVPELTKAVQKREKLLLVPFVPNFPAVDSILYDPNDRDAVVTCIQVTVSDTHDILTSGLGKFQNWLQYKTPLEDLRPSKNRPWRFVFVVPSGNADTFKLQKFEKDTATEAWAGKVHQYVLGLKEEMLFRRGSNSSIQHATTSQGGEQQVRC